MHRLGFSWYLGLRYRYFCLKGPVLENCSIYGYRYFKLFRWHDKPDASQQLINGEQTSKTEVDLEGVPKTFNGGGQDGNTGPGMVMLFFLGENLTTLPQFMEAIWIRTIATDKEMEQ